MPTNDLASDSPSGDASVSWRELAVARSLDPARVRAEKRVQRFLDAALELMNGASGKDFTVQEVVERSGQSLRSFYQYFAGKYELLLALFEESVRTTADHLSKIVADEEDPLERLHRFIIEYHRICEPVPAKGRGKKGPTPVIMAEFAQQLLTTHPQEAARAFIPLVSLFEEVVDQAATAGVIREDAAKGRLAGVVLQAVMFNTFARTISGSSDRRGPDDAEELWDIVVHGIGTGARS
jgi:AcrR family transcriptional regulator